MNLITQSCKLIEQAPTYEGLLKHIELCGRICYKSESKITEDSARKFVDMLIKNKHYSVLEHGTIYFKDSYDDKALREEIYIKDYNIWNQPWSRVSTPDFPENFTSYYTTNYRALIENNTTDYINWMGPAEKPHIKRATVQIVTNRAIANELVRHRVFSFSQESSRYVNYLKKGLSFIIPTWLQNSPTKDINYQGWTLFLQGVEDKYNKLIENGYKPEEARGILPLDTKTELVMTGFTDDWEQFFKLRCVPQAHPQMRELANMIKNELKQNNYELSN